jgi:glycogen debranching enzyme
MEEVIQVHDQFYILAASSSAEEHRRVLKHGETFAVLDRFANIQRLGLGEQGIFHEGTRFLSRWELRIRGRRPLLLSSRVGNENVLLTADLSNPDYSTNEQDLFQRDQVHFARAAFLWQGVYYERIRLRSFALETVRLTFDFGYDADFVDVFEVRGTKREQRGELLEPTLGDDFVELAYRGLDDVVRRTHIHWNPAPAEIGAARCEFQIELAPHAETSLLTTIACRIDDRVPEVLSYEAALAEARQRASSFRSRQVEAETSDAEFNEWWNRSSADLCLMTTQTQYGPYPYAGVPWFSTAFGRDGILTAYEYLLIDPLLARGVLAYLAAYQATGSDPARDAEPGKILHEVRSGEMANLREIPFDLYYGSVDATPLFVVLAGAYYRRTADLEFARDLWPHIDAAVRWIDQRADIDGDGLYEYNRQASNGLSVQGWKDSDDSVFHANGDLAEGPVALCEVQGYVYAAKLAAADIAEALGSSQQARVLRHQAENLKARFNDAFWCEEIGTYALAIDGHKQACKVRASNVGHCLWSRIVDENRAAQVADVLLSDASFSGWGIRTVAEGESRYNPMAYHNGSIWPHDNAIIAAGLCYYRLNEPLLKLFDGLFAAARFVEGHRMPELFCGFARVPTQGPTMYPVACAPQSWAAASVFLLLQSVLGLSIDAPRQEIRFDHSILPPSLKHVRLNNLSVGNATVDLVLQRFRFNVGVEVLRREGNVRVVLNQ